MNETQFLLLQDAVQWAADEHDMYVARVDSGNVGWYQGAWAQGEVDAGSVETDRGTYRPVRMDCGSACCLAGTGVLLAGATMVVNAGKGFQPGKRINTDACVTRDGELKNISGYAREVFGLNYAQGEMLFGANNSVDDLIYYATQYAAKSGFALTVQRKSDG